MASSKTEALGARLLESLRQHPGSGTAWVAFSGGPDSTAVLAALHAIRQALSRRLAAVHVDHGWHPQSQAWARHCETVCASLDIAFRCLPVQAADVPALGPEAALREARYAAFAEMLEPGDLLITAHHREDQAGTLLLNALRAAGSRGLAGMPHSRPLGAGTLVRPALDEDPASLHRCLLESGLHWIQDPGNDDPDLDRNFLRREVLPLLTRRWPGAINSLARSADHARMDSQLLDALGESLLHGRIDVAGVLEVNPGWLAELPTVHLVIRHWLRRQRCAPPPGRRLQEFCRQLARARPDGAVRLDWADHSLRYWQGRLWLQDGDLPPCPATQWDGRDPLSLGVMLGRLDLQGGSGLPWPVCVGPRRGGERLAVAGGHHHKVKALLRQAGVPPWMRDSIPLLFHDDEPVAIGDWALAPELDQSLREKGAALRWTPGHPALGGIHKRLVESTT